MLTTADLLNFNWSLTFYTPFIVADIFWGFCHTYLGTVISLFFNEEFSTMDYLMSFDCSRSLLGIVTYSGSCLVKLLYWMKVISVHAKASIVRSIGYNFYIVYKILAWGTWWSSGKHSCLLLTWSWFESCCLQNHFMICCTKRRKLMKKRFRVGPF